MPNENLPSLEGTWGCLPGCELINCVGLTGERGRAFLGQQAQSNDRIMGSNALVFSRDLSFIPDKTN